MLLNSYRTFSSGTKFHFIEPGTGVIDLLYMLRGITDLTNSLKQKREKNTFIVTGNFKGMFFRNNFKSFMTYVENNVTNPVGTQ